MKLPHELVLWPGVLYSCRDEWLRENQVEACRCHIGFTGLELRFLTFYCSRFTLQLAALMVSERNEPPEGSVLVKLLDQEKPWYVPRESVSEFDATFHQHLTHARQRRLMNTMVQRMTRLIDTEARRCAAAEEDAARSHKAMLVYQDQKQLIKLGLQIEDSLPQMWAILQSGGWRRDRTTLTYHRQGCSHAPFTSLEEVREWVLQLLDSWDAGCQGMFNAELPPSEYDSEDDDCMGEAPLQPTNDGPALLPVNIIEPHPRLTTALLDLDERTTLSAERAAELKTASSTITTAIQMGRGSSVYLCGSPGTGKTLTSQHIGDAVEDHVHRAFVNAVTAPPSTRFYCSVLEAIVPGAGAEVKAGGAAKDHLRSLFVGEKRTRPILLTIDEADRVTANVLRQLFLWAHADGSVLQLLCIGNTIDMVRHVDTKTIIFTTYSYDQMYSILHRKLGHAMHESAIMLCAKRAASAGGDLRTALSWCTLAVERAMEVDAVSDIVTLSDMQHIIPSIRTHVVDTLPLAAQVLLCVCLTKGSSSIEQLQGYFVNACETIKISFSTGGCSSSQFTTLLSALVEAGAVVKHHRVVRPALTREHVQNALQGKPLFNRLLRF